MSDKQVRATPPPDMLLNKLVLEYLEHSGRTKAARLFRFEADFDPSRSTQSDSLTQRGEIRRRILSGNIIGAIEAINDFDPELLDLNPDLSFILRLQAFVEMVKVPGYDLETVLAFAAEEFVPCPDYMLRNLEEVMALLAFENPAESPLGEVLQRREKVAAKVNHAILQAQGSDAPELVSTLASVAWLDKYCKGRQGSLSSDNGASTQQAENSNEFFEDFL